MQRRRHRGLFLFLAVGAVSAAGYDVERADAQADEPPAVERCREFCGRVYSENSDDYEECALACDEADACHRTCKEKLGSDRPKVQKCLRACMRRSDEPSDEAGEKPIEL